MAAYGIVGLVPIVIGQNKGAFAPRLEETTATSGAIKRHTLVFDKPDSSLSPNVEWEFEFIIPASYSATTGYRFNLWWAVDGLPTGNVVWGIKFEKIKTTTSQVVDTYLTAQETTTAVPTTANGHAATVLSVVIANLDTPAKGDVYRALLYRKNSSATDTFVGAAKLVSVAIEDY